MWWLVRGTSLGAPRVICSVQYRSPKRRVRCTCFATLSAFSSMSSGPSEACLVLQFFALLDFINVDSSNGDIAFDWWYPSLGILTATCFVIAGCKGVSSPTTNWTMRQRALTYVRVFVAPARGRKSLRHRRPCAWDNHDHPCCNTWCVPSLSSAAAWTWCTQSQ